MLKKLIIFLIRRRLKLRKHEHFQFANQKSNAVYYFTDDSVMKLWHGITAKSSVSLNWLMDDECDIVKSES